MHRIQEAILKNLTLSDKSRYSAIKPSNTEGNQFSYHLKEVIKNDLVVKEGLFYKLTPKGKLLADNISLRSFTKRQQPKIVTMVYAKDKNNGILLYKREKQPFIGKYSLPYGKIHLGERIEDAAKREVEDKIGLNFKKLKRRGDAYIAIYENNEVVSHMLCHVFEAFGISGEVKSGCIFKNLSQITRNECVSGTFEIIKLLEKRTGGIFFKEIFVEE